MNSRMRSGNLINLASYRRLKVAQLDSHKLSTFFQCLEMRQQRSLPLCSYVYQRLPCRLAIYHENYECFLNIPI